MIKKLIGEKVLVRPDKKKDKTENGFIIPEKAQGIPRRGVVIKSGIDGISEGDTVRFKPYAWFEVEYDKQTYFIIERKNIVAKEI